MKLTLPSPHVRVACVIAAVMVAIAFLTAAVSGAPTVSAPLGPNTWTEIALILVGGGLGIWALLRAGLPRRPHWGSISVALFAAVAVLTALSLAWSVAPDQSWLEAARTAAYLAVFAGAAVCARQMPGQWQTLASAIAIATVALSSWALLVKIFDWPLSQQLNYGRLTAPFGYWNATGLIAAMGLPATIWASARRRRSVILRGLAVPAISVLITVVLLSYSRSALLAAVLGLAVPLALSELKLRSLFKLGLGAIGAAIMSIWALSNANLSADSGLFGASVLPHAARSSSSREFGFVVLAVVVVFTVIGIASARWADTIQLTVAVRKRLHMVLAGLLACVPVLLVIALAFSSRGIGGEVSHVWDSLTKVSAGTGDSSNRLTSLSNSRPSYWHQAISVFSHRPVAGTGADTFNPALLQFQTAKLTSPAQRAHSYVFQTLADFGVIGGLLNLALLLCWSLAAVRTFAYKGWPGQAGRPGRNPRQGLWGPEREGTLALLGVVVAFGASSLIDWTWFYPGVAVPALAAAGWLAGRGPLNREASAGQTAKSEPVRQAGRPQPAPFVAAALVAIVALLAAWYTWQPLRAQNAKNAAQTALTAGDGRTALDYARNATSYQPEALQSWKTLSTVYQALRYWPKARAALVTGTEKQPRNPASWTALGTYYVCNGHPHEAVAPLTRATQLDVTILAATKTTNATNYALAQGLAAARAGAAPPASLCKHSR